MPFIGGNFEANENLSKQGIILPSEAIYRCPSDPSERKPFVDPTSGQIDGVENRTSYLMNSLLSHKTRRYGQWSLLRFVNEVGTSQFVRHRAGEPLLEQLQRPGHSRSLQHPVVVDQSNVDRSIRTDDAVRQRGS